MTQKFGQSDKTIDVQEFRYWSVWVWVIWFCFLVCQVLLDSWTICAGVDLGFRPFQLLNQAISGRLGFGSLNFQNIIISGTFRIILQI
jgi:hypothetical protein